MKRGAAKAKANAAQGIPEMLETASGKKFEQNKEKKHQWNAKRKTDGTGMNPVCAPCICRRRGGGKV